MLGDSAYKLEKYLLVPYRNNGRLTEEELIFNTVHSKCRIDIERAFGLLKGRFRRLKFMETKRTELISIYIAACVILHNLCVDNDDQIDAADDDEPPTQINTVNDEPTYADSSSSEDEQTQNLSEGQRKRRNITNSLF